MHGHEVLDWLAAIVLVSAGAALIARAWRARIAIAAGGGHASPLETHAPPLSVSKVQAIAAAALALAAATIHFSVGPEHFAVSQLYGVISIALAAGHVVAAIGVTLFGTRPWRGPIGFLSLAVIAIWVASGTLALPYLSAPWALEQHGPAESLAAALAVALAGIVIAPTERLTAESEGARMADALSIAVVPFIGAVGIGTLLALASMAPVHHH